MADLLDAASEVDAICRRMGWRHCVNGGMADSNENLQPLAEVKEAPELIANLRALEKKWRRP